MDVLQIVLGFVLIAFSLGISVLVALQPGKDKRLSGAISGGAADTFFGKSKAQRREKRLEKITVLVSVVFFIAIVALYCLV
ncbi:MAG: preprotein translocase subunit SecG [Ruminococcaceae bacterium]|nr:preprotein translocase subunit SecG [Oscillospiraceae bacterium]